MVLPRIRSPALSPSSIMRNAGRSFTEPPGLKNSSLAYTSTAAGMAGSYNRSSGVFPMPSRMETGRPTTFETSGLTLACLLLLNPRGRTLGTVAFWSRLQLTAELSIVCLLSTGINGTARSEIYRIYPAAFWVSNSPLTLLDTCKCDSYLPQSL